jgi:hypothetical protein
LAKLQLLGSGRRCGDSGCSTRCRPPTAAPTTRVRPRSAARRWGCPRARSRRGQVEVVVRLPSGWLESPTHRSLKTAVLPVPARIRAGRTEL